MEAQKGNGDILIEALAEYLEVEPESIHGFIFACERDDDEAGLTLSSAWSLNTPFWHLLGYLDEAHHQLERQFRTVVPASNGAAEKPNRAARRGRGSRRGQ